MYKAVIIIIMRQTIAFGFCTPLQKSLSKQKQTSFDPGIIKFDSVSPWQVLPPSTLIPATTEPVQPFRMAKIKLNHNFK